MKNERCTTPTVQKCLSCPKPDCDCIANAKIHVSEIRALYAAGMVKAQAVRQHYSTKGWHTRKVCHGD